MEGLAVGKRTLKTMSYAELEAELRRREKTVKNLVKKRDRLVAQLEEVDAQIKEAGGSATRHGASTTRRRPKNDGNLADTMAKVLKNKTMSVTELAQAVQDAGYVTTSANFRVIVNQTLLKDKRFKRISRGQYTVKAARSRASSKK